MAKHVCVECKCEYRIKKNDAVAVEMFNQNEEIYRIWFVDLWECPRCHKELISGFATRPLMEHYQGDIKAKVKELEAKGNRIHYIEEVI